MLKMDEFKDRFNSLKAQEALKKKQADSMGNLRLIVFLLGAAAVVLLFIKTNLFYGFLSLAIVLFVFI